MLIDGQKGKNKSVNSMIVLKNIFIIYSFTQKKNKNLSIT